MPKKVLWWTLGIPGVGQRAVHIIQGMFSNARRCVRVNGQYSEKFGMGVGEHQGSVLSPLLFILALEALLCELCTSVSWELLYADGLDTQEECISKLKAWEAGIESKVICVNMKKTKFLVSGVGHDALEKVGKYPCAAWCGGVGNNSILCSQCMLWVHKRYSGIAKQLVANWDYVYPMYNGTDRPIDGRTVNEVDVDGTMLDVEDTFCYLDDMLCSGEDCESAIAARCVAWGK